MNNNLIYNNNNNDNKRGDKKPPPKKFDFKCCKDNTIKSLNDVEYFLNNLNKFSRYIHLYKFFK